MADQNQNLPLVVSEILSRGNTEMLIATFREEGLYVRQLLQQHDARITRLEDNQPNK